MTITNTSTNLMHSTRAVEQTRSMVVAEAEALRPKPAEEAGAEAPRPKQAEEAEAEAHRRPKVEEVVAVLTLREAEEDAEQLHPTEEVAVASLPPMVAVEEVERH